MPGTQKCLSGFALLLPVFKKSLIRRWESVVASAGEPDGTLLVFLRHTARTDGEDSIGILRLRRVGAAAVHHNFHTQVIPENRREIDISYRQCEVYGQHPGTSVWMRIRTIDQKADSIVVCISHGRLPAVRTFSAFLQGAWPCSISGKNLWKIPVTAELYRGAVAKYAFDRFLHHIFHSRSGEFLDLFARIVADFSRVTSQELPTDLLKKDLPSLGYSGEEIEHRFSHEIAREDLKNSLMERYRDLLINRLTRGNLEELQLYLAHQYDARHGGTTNTAGDWY